MNRILLSLALCSPSLAVAASTGPSDVEDNGGYLSTRFGLTHLSTDVVGGSAPTVHVELGREVAENIQVGVLLRNAVFNGMYYGSQYDMLGEVRIPGDFWLGQVGLAAHYQIPLGLVKLGFHGQIGAALRQSPMTDDAYEQEILSSGTDPGLSAIGPWAMAGGEVHLPLADPGPSLYLTPEVGYLLVSGLYAPAAALSFGVMTPF